MKHLFFKWRKNRASLLTVGLVAVLAASACAPAVSSSPPQALTSATATAQPQSAAPSLAAPAPTQAAVVQPVATSRGPNLEATDPATVSLASGGLQLVEFFRFT